MQAQHNEGHSLLQYMLCSNNHCYFRAVEVLKLHTSGRSATVYEKNRFVHMTGTISVSVANIDTVCFVIEYG